MPDVLALSAEVEDLGVEDGGGVDTSIDLMSRVSRSSSFLV